MPPPGIRYRIAPDAAAPLSLRADVAAFVGLVRARDGQGGGAPVAVPSLAAFEALFDGEARLVEEGRPRTMPAMLALAVRSFFAEGGRTCTIVPCGDPLPLVGDPAALRALRLAALGRILPGHAGSLPAAFDDPASWRGLAHLAGLRGVAMVCLPDLAELLAGVPEPVAVPVPPEPPEVFRPDGEAPPGSAPAAAERPARLAPRLDAAAVEGWRAAVAAALRLVERAGGTGGRDVQLLAALPLPRDGAAAAALDAALLALGEDPGAALLQPVFPWVETLRSGGVPEGLETPEGVLAGVVARNALARGGFRSAAGQPLLSVRRSEPGLSPSALRAGRWAEALAGLPAETGTDWIGDRVTLIGRDPGGFALVSDATLSPDPRTRPGAVRRLVGIVLRAAREEGEALVFEPDGEASWTRLRRRFEELMTRLWQQGALDGATAAEAFEVRCDRSTMTAADIDAGRMVARIAFTAAQPVQRITVTFAVQDGTAILGRAA